MLLGFGQNRLESWLLLLRLIREINGGSLIFWLSIIRIPFLQSCGIE